jgi:hypothetical protein
MLSEEDKRSNAVILKTVKCQIWLNHFKKTGERLVIKDIVINVDNYKDKTWYKYYKKE